MSGSHVPVAAVRGPTTNAVSVFGHPIAIVPGSRRGSPRAWSLLSALTWPPIHLIGLDMKRQSAAFKLSKQQSAERDVLAADLREKATALNAAIAAFNRAIEPLSRPVIEALEDYNAILAKARALAGGIAEAAQDECDARSERWRQSDKGTEVRSWIEQWEVSLDDIDLDLPEPLTEIDIEQQVSEIEGPPSGLSK
jgi:hypothetical protein